MNWNGALSRSSRDCYLQYQGQILIPFLDNHLVKGVAQSQSTGSENQRVHNPKHHHLDAIHWLSNPSLEAPLIQKLAMTIGREITNLIENGGVNIPPGESFCILPKAGEKTTLTQSSILPQQASKAEVAPINSDVNARCRKRVLSSLFRSFLGWFSVDLERVWNTRQRKPGDSKTRSFTKRQRGVSKFQDCAIGPICVLLGIRRHLKGTCQRRLIGHWTMLDDWNTNLTQMTQRNDVLWKRRNLTPCWRFLYCCKTWCKQTWYEVDSEITNHAQLSKNGMVK